MKERKDMTKEELIQAIEKKVARAKPIAKQTLLHGLKYRTKPELKQILKKARVSRDGYDISLV